MEQGRQHVAGTGHLDGRGHPHAYCHGQEVGGPLGAYVWPPGVRVDSCAVVHLWNPPSNRLAENNDPHFGDISCGELVALA